MSEAKHSPEPWSFDEYEHVRHADGRIVCLSGFSLSTGGGPHAEPRENDRRTVACVNACVGVSTEELETLKPGDIASALGLLP